MLYSEALLYKAFGKHDSGAAPPRRHSSPTSTGRLDTRSDDGPAIAVRYRRAMLHGLFDHPLLDQWQDAARRRRLARCLKRAGRVQAARVIDGAAGDAPAALPPLEDPEGRRPVDGPLAIDAVR